MLSPALVVAASIVAPFHLTGDVTISGTGCGNPGSANVALPAGASDAAVRKPAVGQVGYGSRIAEAVIDGGQARFTAVGDRETCDPAAGDTPPDQRAWNDTYAYVVDYRTRVTVAYLRSGRLRVRPSKVTIGEGATTCCWVSPIRWRSFGGRTAVGYGRFHASGVPKGARCLECGRRYEVVLSRPSRCADLGEDVYYGKVAFVTTRRIGVLKPGTEQFSVKPYCYSGAQRLRATDERS
jgi:hypothetical protein